MKKTILIALLATATLMVTANAKNHKVKHNGNNKVLHDKSYNKHKNNTGKKLNKDLNKNLDLDHNLERKAKKEVIKAVL